MTSNCYAYIDPATTSYVVQIIAGIVIACGATIGVLWSKFSRSIKKKKMENIEELTMDKNTALEGKSIVTAKDLLEDNEDN